MLVVAMEDVLEVASETSGQIDPSSADLNDPVGGVGS